MHRNSYLLRLVLLLDFASINPSTRYASLLFNKFWDTVFMNPIAFLFIPVSVRHRMIISTCSVTTSKAFIVRLSSHRVRPWGRPVKVGFWTVDTRPMRWPHWTNLFNVSTATSASKSTCPYPCTSTTITASIGFATSSNATR